MLRLNIDSELDALTGHRLGELDAVTGHSELDAPIGHGRIDSVN